MFKLNYTILLILTHFYIGYQNYISEFLGLFYPKGQLALIKSERIQKHWLNQREYKNVTEFIMF